MQVPVRVEKYRLQKSSKCPRESKTQDSARELEYITQWATLRGKKGSKNVTASDFSIKKTFGLTYNKRGEWR